MSWLFLLLHALALVLQMLWPKPWKRIVLQVVERTVTTVALNLEVKRMKQHCLPEHLFMNNNDCSQFVLPSCTVNLLLTGRALSRHMLPWWQPHRRYDESRVGTTHLHVGMFWYGREFWYQYWRLHAFSVIHWSRRVAPCTILNTNRRTKTGEAWEGD